MTLEGLPPDARVTLTVGQLRKMLAEHGRDPGQGRDRSAPLTVPEVADRLGRSESRVRDYLAAGELEGFHVGREWRVRPEAVDAFFDRCEAAEEGSLENEGEFVSGDPQDANTSAWREELEEAS